MPTRTKNTKRNTKTPIATSHHTATKTRRNWWVLTIAVIALVVLFGSYAAKVGYEHWRVAGITTTMVRYTVTSDSRIGFALGTGDLVFGKIMPGGGGTRTATITAAESTIAVFAPSSNLIGLILVEPNPATLDAGVPMNVTFDLTVPIGTPLGEYEGAITTTYLRRLPWE